MIDGIIAAAGQGPAPRFKPFARMAHLMDMNTVTLSMSAAALGPLTECSATVDGGPEGADYALARRAAAGDSHAFEQLYRAHVDRIHGLCCRLCHGDTARAEQSTQDAFVRAWEKIGSFRGESRFGTWLHRLTVNVVLGEHRLLKRWVTFDEDIAPDGEAAQPMELMLRHEDVGSRVDLERALARLPKGARAVLILHDVEGYQHEEISTLTGIAVGTSKAQLHRARRLLREWLQ